MMILKSFTVITIFAILQLFGEAKISKNEEISLLRKFEKKHVNADLKHENELPFLLVEKTMNEIPSPVYEFDPCEKMYCGAGKICKSNGDTAECICIQDCPPEIDERRYVCTNLNKTWSSDCAVYRAKCLCNTNNPDCEQPEYNHIHIDYYGSCKQVPQCTEEEMSDFPRRMRDWLFNVMRDLAERDELNDYYMKNGIRSGNQFDQTLVKCCCLEMV